MPEDLDRNLQALFDDHTRDLNDEPFVGSTLARIESQRSRVVLGKLLRVRPPLTGTHRCH